jgi:molybdopterin converting factor small subunit
MITVHAQFLSHFKEISGTEEDQFELAQPLMSALANSICERFGPRMRAVLIDPNTHELNERGTMFVDAKGRRISMEDPLEDGDVITFMMGIAGG